MLSRKVKKKRAAGSTVGNGNRERERERRKVTWLNDTTLKDLRVKREKLPRLPTLMRGLHLVINGRRSRSYSGLRDRLVDLHVAHTFLFKENKEVGTIDRTDGGWGPIVTLGGDGDGRRRKEMAKMMTEGGLPSPSARGHDLHTAGDYDGNN